MMTNKWIIKILKSKETFLNLNKKKDYNNFLKIKRLSNKSKSTKENNYLKLQNIPSITKR